MRYWVSGVLLVAVIAAVYGYVGRYGGRYSLIWLANVSSRVLLLIFLVLFVLTVAKHLARSTS